MADGRNGGPPFLFPAPANETWQTLRAVKISFRPAFDTVSPQISITDCLRNKFLVRLINK
jgi:hypothetical protein